MPNAEIFFITIILILLFITWLRQPHPAKENFHCMVVATTSTVRELLLCSCHNYIVETLQLDLYTNIDVVVATKVLVVPYFTIFCGCGNHIYVSHIHRVFSVSILFI